MTANRPNRHWPEPRKCDGQTTYIGIKRGNMTAKRPNDIVVNRGSVTAKKDLSDTDLNHGNMTPKGPIGHMPKPRKYDGQKRYRT